MNLTGGVILYTVLWFLTLFVVLPFGQKSQAEAGRVVPGTPAGAPADPRMKRKLIWTTMISAALWVVIAWVIFSGAVSREDLLQFDRMFRE